MELLLVCKATTTAACHLLYLRDHAAVRLDEVLVVGYDLRVRIDKLDGVQ